MLNRLIVIGILVLTALALPAGAQPSTVLVLPFENLSNDRNLDWIGEGIAELIIDRLRPEAGLHVFSRDERLAAYNTSGIHENASISRATAVTLGWSLGADSIITGTVSGGHDDFRIDARIIDLATIRSPDPDRIVGKLEELIPMTNTVSLVLLRKLVPATTALEMDYTSRPPIPRSAFENYVRGLLSSDPQKRQELFQDAIRLHPQYLSAMFELARLLHEEMQFKESNSWIEKLGGSGPDPIQSRFIKGLNYYYLADYVQAIQILGELPPTYDSLIDMGVALADKGDAASIASALEAWKRASEMDPLGGEALFNAGYLNLVKGDAEAAVRSLDQFLKLQGRDAEGLFLLGRAYERLGRLDESQRLISQATRLSPRLERWVNQPLPKFQRLRTVPVSKPIDWTVARLTRRAKGESPALLVESVQKLVDSQLYGDALRQLLEVVHIFPGFADAHLMLAEVYNRQKDYERAAQALQTALGLAPDDPAALKLKNELEKVLPPARRLR